MASAVDDIDRRILYHLASDARHTSAPDIAAEVDVSAATIRNRIRQLEERGVIEGYFAQIDYEKTDGRLTYLFICTADPPRSEYFAREAREIPGVIGVRELLSGRRNIQIVAVGADKADIQRISRDLSNLGLEIEDEALVQNEFHEPYHDFAPESARSSRVSSFMNLRELAGEATVLDVTVAEDALAAGSTVRELAEQDDFAGISLIVAIERGEEMITPNGGTEIRAGDIVTIVSQSGDDRFVRLFAGAHESE